MKKIRKFNAGMALGSLTAAVALFAGAPVATAQTTSDTSDTSVSGQAAPGGGSFPGSFLVPGTNTSIKFGGLAKAVAIFDHSAANGDTVGFSAVPLDGATNGAHQLHGATRIQARQSNFSFDVRTPTAWGELDTFILTDFFGQNTANGFSTSNTQNARLVLAYGTLGPVLIGQSLSLFFDGDAIGESVDPTISVGVNNGLTNRQPQFRYTYLVGNGISVAASAEQPVWETVSPANGVVQGGIAAGTINRYPDFLIKGRWDQAWGHVALAGVVRDQVPRGISVARTDETGWGINLTGHLNTFGKDTLRGGAMIGQALGHYLSQERPDAPGGGFNGLQETFALSAGGTTTGDIVAKPVSYGAHIDYTHWWTNELRSTILTGYEHVNAKHAIFNTPALLNTVNKYIVEATLNLIWSPVPQVDFGMEYTWGRRTTHAAAGPTSDSGDLNRSEIMGVFKF